MYGVVLYETQPSKFPRIIEAKRAHLGEFSCNFFDGRISGMGDSGGYQSHTYFQELEYPVDKFYVEPYSIQTPKSPRQMNLIELYEYNTSLERLGQSSKGMILNWFEFWNKTSIPFACIIFAWVGASLGLNLPLGNEHWDWLVSRLVIFVYHVFMAASKAFAVGGYILPCLGAWLPNILFCLLGLVFLRRSFN